jgi:hypothetical protein
MRIGGYSMRTTRRGKSCASGSLHRRSVEADPEVSLRTKRSALPYRSLRAHTSAPFAVECSGF